MLIVGSGVFLVWQLSGVGKNAKTTIDPIQDKAETAEKVTLTFWGAFEDASVFAPIIAAYQKNHPNVTINYVRKDPSIYEFISLQELAAQEGPDIWLIPSEWLPKHRDKLSPLPEGLLATQNNLVPPKKTFKKREPTPTNIAIYPKIFAKATAAENIVDGQIYSLPLAIDTLGLFGNAQLLKDRGVEKLPQTWEEVITAVKQLSGRNGATLTRPAIGMGASGNVTRAPEILAALLMQNNTPMIDPTKTAALYNQTVLKSTGEPIKPGPKALDFYTSFASPTKENFSWSTEQPNDFELFAKGELPLYIDYSFRVRDVRQAAPGLPLATSFLPQITGTESPLTLASSLMVSVPSVSKQPNQAWDFISFLTAPEQALAYSRAASRPPARLELLKAQPSDAALIPFIAQIESTKGTAAYWFRNDVKKTDTVFRQGIDAVLAGQTPEDVIIKLAKQITHILRGEPHE